MTGNRKKGYRASGKVVTGKPISPKIWAASSTRHEESPTRSIDLLCHISRSRHQSMTIITKDVHSAPTCGGNAVSIPTGIDTQILRDRPLSYSEYRFSCDRSSGMMDNAPRVKQAKQYLAIPYAIFLAQIKAYLYQELSSFPTHLPFPVILNLIKFLLNFNKKSTGRCGETLIQGV